MPRLIAIEGHESQRRELEELLAELSREGYVLTGRREAVSIGGGWPEVVAVSRSGGLFDDRRVTVVEGAEQLGVFPASLGGLLDPGADDAIVAVFGGEAKKFFGSGLDVAFIRPEAAVPPWKRKDWLLGLARGKGMKMEPAAAALLAESMESQEELRAELDKLALAADGKPIAAELVKRLSFDEGGNALLRFLDGVCEARPRDVLSALEHLRSDPSPLPLLTALYNRLRPALHIACFTSPRAAEKALAAIGATREYALRKARSALEHYGGEGVKLFALSLIRLSFLEKTSAGEGWPGFEAALWKLMSESRG
jgi:DNA polymerase-3 subunit delta